MPAQKKEGWTEVSLTDVSTSEAEKLAFWKRKCNRQNQSKRYKLSILWFLLFHLRDSKPDSLPKIEYCNIKYEEIYKHNIIFSSFPFLDLYHPPVKCSLQISLSSHTWSNTACPAYLIPGSFLNHQPPRSCSAF